VHSFVIAVFLSLSHPPSVAKPGRRGGRLAIELGEAEELFQRIAGGKEVAGVGGQFMPLADNLDVVAGFR
jgi:hypothetical protein